LISRLLVILLFATGAFAQQDALLSGTEATDLFTRSIQLAEATAISVPGLVRAAAPLVENARQSLLYLRSAGSTAQPDHTYRILVNLKAYLALADSMPKPHPFPDAASAQFSELRDNVRRIDAHFEALLIYLEEQLRDPDPNDLARYAEDNTRVADPVARDPRVVFLGDSITDLWRLNEYFPEKDYINRGISGQVTSQMLGRMQADVIALQPVAMVVMAGTNDIARGASLKAIEDNIRMIATLAASNNIRLVVASVLPVHDYNQEKDPSYLRSAARPAGTILDLNDWIRRFCAERGAVYLDYFSAMVDDNGALRQELADDGLHPNAEGYRVMAPLAEQAIETVLRGRGGVQQEERRRRFPF